MPPVELTPPPAPNKEPIEGRPAKTDRTAELELRYRQCHERTRARGVNKLLYHAVRGLLVPFFRIYFRLDRIGREHVPSDGPVIFAANHRSFLDPFIIGTMTRRPLFYVAKKELFGHRIQAWFLNSLGAIPVDRGRSDEDMLATARAVLDRGDSLVIFPEGTRIRPGALGRPKRGVGRMALETGAPVVPIALIGTEDVRRKWRVYPRKVRIRAGSPLVFPQTSDPSPELAEEVTSRIWPRIELQWEWLGGLPPMRKAAVIGAGSWGTAVAALLIQAGMEVTLGARTLERAEKINSERRSDRLPEVDLPPELEVKQAGQIELSGQDLVVFAVPSKELPGAVAQAADRIGQRSAVLVLSKGLVPPLGTLPSEYVGSRVRARAIACLGGPAHAAEAVLRGASVVLATPDESMRRQLGDALEQAGLEVERSDDLVGTELAGCAKNVAALAASAAAAAGMNAAGAAAGHTFLEVERLARLRYGARHETFTGLAGTGDLVATVLAAGSRNRRAGEMLGAGVSADQIKRELGHVAEAVDTVPLLAKVFEESGTEAPTVFALRDLINGAIAPEDWVRVVRRAA
ncbi:MAG: 1-acyl-sn-glycerol-3-phosphate acyltransferase [Actinobacteria bacterium]|nr:1-acyl-sn-glycerol-3-phosphate acyltransferase [Actinomycetota bacterium]